MTCPLTDNLHREEQTGASSHVGNHTAVLAAVLRSDFLYLQVLTPSQPLDTTSRLIKQEEEETETVCETEETACCQNLLFY